MYHKWDDELEFLTLDNNLRRKERERQQSLDTEQWLKNRFRQGFHELKAAFNNHKQSNKGMVSGCVKLSCTVKICPYHSPTNKMD